MGIIKKLGEKELKIRWATENLMLNSDSPLRCDYCFNRLGIFRMMKKSFFKKKGVEYKVVCLSCKKINKRIKGKIGFDIDKTWDDSFVFQKEGE